MLLTWMGVWVLAGTVPGTAKLCWQPLAMPEHSRWHVGAALGWALPSFDIPVEEPHLVNLEHWEWLWVLVETPFPRTHKGQPSAVRSLPNRLCEGVHPAPPGSLLTR